MQLCNTSCVIKRHVIVVLKGISPNGQSEKEVLPEHERLL